jgi:SAM-dependent methyltransferase
MYIMSPSTLLTVAMTRLRNIINSRILKRWGSTQDKENIWDREFQAGSWRYLDSTAHDHIYSFLHRYLKGGCILDLGCGAGNTGNELHENSYNQYTGVDVSRVATELAALRSAHNGRGSINHYICSDIADFTPARKYNIILFRESLFYIPLHRIGSVLLSYKPYLADDGVFIVRMCDRRKYSSIVRLIESRFAILEKSPSSDPEIILVFH